MLRVMWKLHQGKRCGFIEAHRRQKWCGRPLTGHSKSVRGAFLIRHLAQIRMRTSFLELEEEIIVMATLLMCELSTLQCMGINSNRGEHRWRKDTRNEERSKMNFITYHFLYM